jgi:hypothetical protein
MRIPGIHTMNARTLLKKSNSDKYIAELDANKAGTMPMKLVEGQQNLGMLLDSAENFVKTNAVATP